MAAARTLIPPLPFPRPCAQWGVLIAIAKLWRGKGGKKSHTRGIQSGRAPPTDRVREFLSFLRVGFADSDLQSFLASCSEGGRGRAEVQFGLPSPLFRAPMRTDIYIYVYHHWAPKTQHFFIFPLNTSVPSPTLRERKYTATLLICENVQHRPFEPFAIVTIAGIFPPSSSPSQVVVIDSITMSMGSGKKNKGGGTFGSPPSHRGASPASSSSSSSSSSCRSHDHELMRPIVLPSWRAAQHARAQRRKG